MTCDMTLLSKLLVDVNHNSSSDYFVVLIRDSLSSIHIFENSELMFTFIAIDCDG